MGLKEEVVEEKIIDEETEKPKDKDLSGIEIRKPIEVSTNDRVMNTRETIGYLSTKPDVTLEYNRLKAKGYIKNPRATEKELKRLGYYVG